MGDVVSTTATDYPLSLPDLKRHLNVSTTHDDLYMRDLIAAGTQYVEGLTNRRFIQQTRQLTLRGFTDEGYARDGKINFPKGPVSSVSSVSYVDSEGTTQTLGSSAYVLASGAQGYLAEAYNETWPATRDQEDSVTITYVVGHGSTASQVPATVRHAIRMTAAHWYRNREAVEIGQVSSEVHHGLCALLGDEERPDYV